MEDGREGQPPPGRKRKGPEAAIAAKYRRGPEVATRRVSSQAGGMAPPPLAAAAAAAAAAACPPFVRFRKHLPLCSLAAAAQIEDKKLKGKLRYTERLVADAQQAAAKVGAAPCAGCATAAFGLCSVRLCASSRQGSCTELDCHLSTPSTPDHLAAPCCLAQVEEWLLPAEAGELEAEGMERTWRFSQADIVQVRQPGAAVWQLSWRAAEAGLCSWHGRAACALCCL